MPVNAAIGHTLYQGINFKSRNGFRDSTHAIAGIVEDSRSCIPYLSVGDGYIPKRVTRVYLRYQINKTLLPVELQVNIVPV